MTTYQITYFGSPAVTITQSTLPLTHRVVLPPPLVPYSHYFHLTPTGQKMVAEIVAMLEPTTAAASFLISPSAPELIEQRAELVVAGAAAQQAAINWSNAGVSARLDIAIDKFETSIRLTDASAPPQALKLTIKRP